MSNSYEIIFNNKHFKTVTLALSSVCMLGIRNDTGWKKHTKKPTKPHFRIKVPNLHFFTFPSTLSLVGNVCITS